MSLAYTYYAYLYVIVDGKNLYAYDIDWQTTKVILSIVVFWLIVKKLKTHWSNLYAIIAQPFNH